MARLASRVYRTPNGQFKLQVLREGNQIMLRFDEQYSFRMDIEQFTDIVEMLTFAQHLVKNEETIPDR